MRVELIRHGETLWQGTGRYQGQTDVPLSEQGRQALSPASFSPEKVYITALQRTRQTAERLFPQARLVVVEDLGEMNFGRFEGRSAAEMEEDPSYRAWVEGMCRGQCPGGESLPAFSRRVCRAFARLLDWAVASEEEQLVLVVHGGTQMAVMEAFAIPSRPYFSWGLPCGQGYVLEAEGWLEHRQLSYKADIFRNNGTGGNDRPVSDVNARHYHRFIAYPYIIAYHDVAFVVPSCCHV